MVRMQRKAPMFHVKHRGLRHGGALIANAARCKGPQFRLLLRCVGTWSCGRCSRCSYGRGGGRRNRCGSRNRSGGRNGCGRSGGCNGHSRCNGHCRGLCGRNRHAAIGQRYDVDAQHDRRAEDADNPQQRSAVTVVPLLLRYLDQQIRSDEPYYEHSDGNNEHLKNRELRNTHAEDPHGMPLSLRDAGEAIIAEPVGQVTPAHRLYLGGYNGR